MIQSRDITERGHDGVAGCDVERLWDHIRQEVGADGFDRYMRGRASIACDTERVEITLPTRFEADLVERRFRAGIERAAASVLGRAPAIALRVERSDEPAPAAPAPSPAPARPRPRSHRPQDDRFSLDEFVVGESNRLAYHAARAVAEEAGAPAHLLIHGECGVGKTHLARGIAARFQRLNPRARVKYLSAESFTNEFIAAVRVGSIEPFRRTYRRLALLCIDDAHFFASKHSTQEELLHTLDAIDGTGARIVLASDQHPRELRAMLPALVSRLAGSLVVALGRPDRALGEALLLRFAARRGLVLTEEGAACAVDLLWRGGKPCTVRDLEGAVTRIAALVGVTPSVADGPDGSLGALAVRMALGPAASTLGLPAPRRRSSRPIPLARIVGVVCGLLAVEEADFRGRGRHGRVVLARSLVAFLARDLTTLSYPEIARQTGRPTHSTVVAAARRIEEMIRTGRPVRDAAGAWPEDDPAQTVAALVDRLRAMILDAAPDAQCA